MLTGVAKHVVAVAKRKGPQASESLEQPTEGEPAESPGPTDEERGGLQEPLLDDLSA